MLAYHCLAEQAGSGRFSGRRVLELGGGMTGLAGLLLAATAGPAAVHLTDGNSNSVDNLERIVARNKDKVGNLPNSREFKYFCLSFGGLR